MNFKQSGVCTTKQPGIPEQVNQHLANIRLENLLAPKWSIILNEHGCQLQVFWGSPKANQIPAENGIPAVNPAQVKLAAPLQIVNPAHGGEPIAKKARPAEGPPIPTSSHHAAGLQNIRQGVVPPMLSQQNMKKLASLPGLFPPNKIRVKSASPTAPIMVTPSRISPRGKEENNTPLNLKTESHAPKQEIKPPGSMTTPTKPQRKSLESTAKQLHSLTQNMALKSAINSLSSNAAAASNLAAFVESATKTASAAARANNHNLSPVGVGFITPPNSERSNSGDGKVSFIDEEDGSINGRSHSESGDGVNDLCRQKFACEMCRKTFTRKYSLSRHYKEVHQGESRTNTMRPGMQENSLLAIANDPRFVNDYGLPTMAHRHNSEINEDVKIEEFDDDESPPSMVPMTRRALDY